MGVGQFFDQYDTLIRESLDEAVPNLEVRATDPASRIIRTIRNAQWMGRPTGSAAGTAGYEARWDVMLQHGGRVTGAKFGNTSAVKMGPGSVLTMGLSATDSGLDPVDTPQRAHLELTSRLRKIRGQITVSFDQLETNLVSKPLEDLAAGEVEDAVIQVRDLETSLFWGAGDGVMAKVGTNATVTEATIQWITVTNGSIYRFIRGQRYVATKTTTYKFDTPLTGDGVTAHTPAWMRCVGVNRRTGKIGLQSEPGEGNIVITTDHYLVLEGMWDFSQTATGAATNEPSLAPNGIENLLISSGPFPDTAITDVTDYPELQAFTDGSEAAPVLPEPEILDNLLDIITGAEADDASVPPILIAERALWTLYGQLERRAMMTQPVNQAFQAYGGVGAVNYTYGNKPFVKLNSPKCRRGAIFGIDPQTFKRFYPNDLNIRWRLANGGAGGVPNVFRPVYNGRIMTDLMAAEFDLWWQVAQTEPTRNAIRIGLYTTATYSG